MIDDSHYNKIDMDADLEELEEERDFPSIGEAVRYMCREGGYDV